MIPISDINPRRRFPYVTVTLIIINVIVFIYEMLNPNLHMLIYKWGIVPKRLFTFGGREYLTLITSMFLHGNFAHIIGNMLYLWIFGDNVENFLGPAKFILFYLLWNPCWSYSLNNVCLIHDSHHWSIRGDSRSYGGILLSLSKCKSSCPYLPLLLCNHNTGACIYIPWNMVFNAAYSCIHLLWKTWSRHSFLGTCGWIYIWYSIDHSHGWKKEERLLL